MAINVALIGSGIFAKEAHLPAIAASSDLNLVAIYSRTLRSAQSLQASPNVTLYSDDAGSGKSFQDLLKSDQIQAVIIAIPITKQPDYIKAALEAGKHVLSEKPIAKDISTAQQLANWYKTTPQTATWGIAENHRFLRSHDTAIAAAAPLGALIGFQVRIHKFIGQTGKYFRTEWRKTPEYQGGFLLDGGIHNIASLRRYLTAAHDHVVRVAAFTAQLQSHLPPIDTVEAVARTAKGVAGVISLSSGTTMQETVYVIAYEKGRLEVGRDHVKVVEFEHSDDGIKEIRNETFDVAKSNDGTDASVWVDVVDEIAVWAKNLKEGSQLDRRLSVEEALADLVLIESIFKSGEENGKFVDL